MSKEVKCSYLIIHNVSKKHNIGNLIRTANAFGVTEICLVGSNKYNSFGSHGSVNHMKFKHFSNMQECVNYLKNKGCQIVGIEIDKNAISIHEFEFKGSTAFIMGNEASGLTNIQKCYCDELLYIPQYGTGTASLNVNVATSIVLHHFAFWANFKEHTRNEQKYLVSEKPLRTNSKGVVRDMTPDEVRKYREERKIENADLSILCRFDEESLSE